VLSEPLSFGAKPIKDDSKTIPTRDDCARRLSRHTVRKSRRQCSRLSGTPVDRLADFGPSTQPFNTDSDRGATITRGAQTGRAIQSTSGRRRAKPHKERCPINLVRPARRDQPRYKADSPPGVSRTPMVSPTPRSILRFATERQHSKSRRHLTSTLSGRRCWRLGCEERSDRNQDDSACGPP
jgi:hypothetical protein